MDKTTPGPGAGDAALRPESIAGFRKGFESDAVKRLIQNVVTQRDVNEVAFNRAIATASAHTFSTVLDDWQVTNQARSGRCWMFAGLNLIRTDTRKALNVRDFEFSQSYVMFWDKLERANFFLEGIIQTADLPTDDRTVAWLLQRGIEDGGQWDMFVGLVKKHGLVPKAVMPETESSSNSAKMNQMLTYQVRQGAKRIRDLYKTEASLKELRGVKQGVLDTVHRILCIHLGTPPATFDWQWKDRGGAFHRDGKMTPEGFVARYAPTPLDEYVCLVNDPRPSNQAGRTYTIEHLGNVVDGQPIVYLNIGIELMKDLTIRQLQEGKPVWFGCDSGKQMHREMGIWDAKLYDYESVYGADFGMDKAARLEYHQTRMTHAMLFTGVDLVDDKPRRWRVENSWDDKVGDKGFFLINDSWFDEYLFEIAAPKSYLPVELQQALGQKPVMLPPWDPMGSLAC